MNEFINGKKFLPVCPAPHIKAQQPWFVLLQNLPKNSILFDIFFNILFLSSAPANTFPQRVLNDL
jgi:hypothetical protein